MNKPKTHPWRIYHPPQPKQNKEKVIPFHARMGVKA